MKAITINNPFATEIAHNITPFWNGNFDTTYRGDLIIVAGKNEIASFELPEFLREKVNDINRLRGNAVCIATLTEIEQVDTYSFNWKFENIRLLRIPFYVESHPLIFDIIPPIFSELLPDEQRRFYYGNVKHVNHE